MPWFEPAREDAGLLRRRPGDGIEEVTIPRADHRDAFVDLAYRCSAT